MRKVEPPDLVNDECDSGPDQKATEKTELHPFHQQVEALNG